MRVRDFEACWIMMDRLMAEDTLRMMSASMYPHAEKKYRTQMHKQIYTRAYPPSEDAPRASMEDFAQLLAGGGSSG